MLVFIDRQHSGNPKKITSRGAAYDFNGDGKKTASEMEAIFTGYLSVELEIQLLDMGVNVMPISDGTYHQRHKRVNDYATMFGGEKMVYLAMHFNAGGGTYGAYFYDHRSAQGKDLAQCICTNANTLLPELQANKFISACNDDWTKNAYYCISGINSPVALCVEPAFIDSVAHRDLFTNEGIKRIAKAIANGIVEWGM